MKLISIRLATLFSIILLGSLFCAAGRAQQVEPRPQKPPCTHTGTITRDNAGATNGKGAWTTATASTDSLLSLTYCGVFKSGPTTISRLPLMQLSDLPNGFERHQKYARLFVARGL